MPADCNGKKYQLLHNGQRREEGLLWSLQQFLGHFHQDEAKSRQLSRSMEAIQDQTFKSNRIFQRCAEFSRVLWWDIVQHERRILWERNRDHQLQREVHLNNVCGSRAHWTASPWLVWRYLRPGYIGLGRCPGHVLCSLQWRVSVYGCCQEECSIAHAGPGVLSGEPGWDRGTVAIDSSCRIACWAIWNSNVRFQEVSERATACNRQVQESSRTHHHFKQAQQKHKVSAPGPPSKFANENQNR